VDHGAGASRDVEEDGSQKWEGLVEDTVLKVVLEEWPFLNGQCGRENMTG
jgi:hypothetical protein